MYSKTKQLLMLAIITIFSTNVLFANDVANNFRNFVKEHEYEKASELAAQVLSENSRNYELILSVGDVYYELENFEESLKAYSLAKKLRNIDNRVFVKLSKTFIKLNKTKEAIKELQEVLKEEDNEENVSLILDLAEAYLADGNAKDAEMQITNARSIDSENPKVFIMLGKLYYEQKIWELAKTNYEAALKLEPTNIEARQLLANVYWKLAVAADSGGDVTLMNEYLNRSLEQCNLALKENDKDAKTWRLKGQIHFNANQKLEAAQAYNKFLSLRPNNYKERWRLADILSTSGVCDSAYTHLNMVIKSNHKDISDSIKTRAELLLASCYYNQKKYNDAVQTFKLVNEKSPLEPKDLQMYSIATLFSGDTTNAIVLFKQLFKVAPEQSCNFMFLVANQILKPRKQYAEMIEVLQQRLETSACSDKNDAYCYYTIGTGYYALHDTTKAIEALQTAIKTQADFYWAYIYLGDIYYAQKNIQASDSLFNAVIAACKVDPEKNKNVLNAAFQKMASSRLDSKKYAALEKIAKEWTTYIQEKNEYGNLFLAIAYQGQGKMEQAKSAYRAVLKINKNNKSAKDNLRALSQSKNK